jgi:hypothetical protein
MNAAFGRGNRLVSAIPIVGVMCLLTISSSTQLISAQAGNANDSKPVNIVGSGVELIGPTNKRARQSGSG